MGRGSASIPALPVPQKPALDNDGLTAIASFHSRIAALERRPSGGISKETAAGIFDVMREAMEKRDERIRKELTDIHTNALTEIRTATRKLEAIGMVSFDSSVALVKQSINTFVGE